MNLLVSWVILIATIGVDLDQLRNPVYATKDNLRDPAVLKTKEGYQLFYSRLSGKNWGEESAWAIATVFTRDFKTFEDDHDVSPKGYASPDGPVVWKGRLVLAYCGYPRQPNKLNFCTSEDGKTWSAPKVFLEEANKLPWNMAGRVIDPTLVVDGDVLHCFFIGSTKPPSAGSKRANLMGHAITRDANLEKWEIVTREKPLMGASESAPDGVENLTIFKNGEQWFMIYSEGLAKQHIALATSKDLMNWKLEGPIKLEKQGWYATKHGAPYVWREGEKWMMILMGENKGRTTLGLLVSGDGRKWEAVKEGK